MRSPSSPASLSNARRRPCEVSMMINRRHALQWIPLAALAAGCVALPGSDPVQVLVVGVEPLQGEGLELRFLCKLRVQNPNDKPIAYDGIYIEFDVRDSTLASGVSDAAGSVPRFGETVLSIPVTASALKLAGQALAFYTANDKSMIDYVLRGKISGQGFGAVRFESRGEMKLPTGPTSPAQPSP